MHGGVTARFLYTASFRDTQARFLVEATSAELARAWGNALAHVRANDKTRPLQFIGSTVAPGDATTPSEALPLVRFGETPCEGTIGW